ncbi:fimbria/pilus outer membrane usher protein [Variovorax sp. GT1P44]|uniref:fimbria/pilus outer membrane usher protein n=1 Tax=Variovorax sp. GT1P44 TaxID=3443742 RepID=UPI003F48EC6D
MGKRSRSSSRLPSGPTLWAVLLASLGTPGYAQQQVAASTFNEEFLAIGGEQAHADLSLFATGNRVTAGTYFVDVILNQRFVGQSDIHFVQREAEKDAVPCLTRGLLDKWGVNVAVFPDLASASEDTCFDDPRAVIPESTVSYDGGKQRLFISIPQAALTRSARGAVDPEMWDKGITAGMMDYQVNFARNDGNGSDNSPAFSGDTSFANGAADRYERDTLFAGVRAGFNLGDWRFRHFSTYNRAYDGRSRWQAINTYVQRDLPSIRGQLLIGDGSTPGDLFDSTQFRGVQVSSDDAMLPDSLQGYAPTIRGMAQTNARVTVRQNGYIIYSTYVAPGPFVLDDLYPTAAGGDLQVTVTEADGRESRFIQAFSAVPTLLREGAWRYSATAGQYRNGYSLPSSKSFRNGETPFFVQGTLARGLGHAFTLYGGTTVSTTHGYQSVLAGVGKNMRGFGAVSVDLSSASSSARNNVGGSGQSLRFLYAKSFADSGTNFRIAGYRYSTSGYRTFEEAVQMRDPFSSLPFNSRRNELRFDMSQQVADKGAVFVSARQQSYWGTSATDRLVQVGYSGNYKQFGYSVFYNYATDLGRSPSRQIMVTLSIPLGSTRASAQYSVTSERGGRVNHQASVYGSAFDDSRLTYNVTAGHSNEQGGSGSASASYLSPMGRLDVGRSQGRGYGQTTLGVAGGLLVHAGGATLSQSLGETVALVQAPNATDVGFDSQPGVATDGAGNAVIPSLSPYRINRIAIRTGDLGDNVEVKNAATELVPTRGAVVVAKFESSVGFRLLMTLVSEFGRPLPLGSKIENEAGEEVGIVGPDGQAFVAGAASKGHLKVIWGHGENDQCIVPYSLPDQENPPPIREFDGQCSRSDASVALSAPPADAEAKE